MKNIAEKFCADFEEHKFIFDNLNDVVWAMSWPDLKVQFISKAIEDSVGYSVEDFKKDPLLLQKITHPEDKKITEKALENLKENGFTEREFRIITKNGNIKWIHDKGKMVYDKYNNPIRVEGLMRDITERKKAEEKIEYNENRYQTIFNSAPIGFMLEDEKGKIIDLNEIMCEIFGYTKKELVGSSVLDKLVLPEYHELARENIKRLIQGEDLEFDIKTPTKTGKIKYYHLKETNIILPDGSKGIISMNLDITERKRLENNLKEKNILLKSILESIQDGIAVLNPDLTIRYANPTMDKWFENKTLKGDKCFHAFLDKEDGCDYCPVQKCLKTGEMESRIKKLPDHFEIDFIEIFSYPIYDDQQEEITGIVEFVRDISERIEKEKEIKYLAYRDSLTDLYNRKFFEAEMDRLDTERQLPISIIMGDLNGLKIINDSYGQKMGDQLLIKTAEMLKEVVRDEDVLARYGGDEFTILLPQTTKKTAEKIVKRIKNKSREQNIGEISLSISLGTATKVEKDKKITEIIKIAEDNLYQNKLSESRSSKSNIVQGLLNTLNAKSSETKEHAVRMTKLAFDFGEKLELSTSELNRLSLLATLHDIGKTTIPEELLKKPAKLDDKEWELIKKHPERGAKIASASEEFALVADSILSHHEKWDGSGYPKGLKGQDIPYLARIITIIDSYDVMTNDRPYSKAMPKEKALAEIKECAGSQFDPELAEVFIEMLGKE
ncbi:MAG: PAS domain S-box protein [Halanaerobium sp.]